MTQSAAGLAILAKAYTRSAAQQSNMAEPAARCAACFILVSMPIWSESNLQHAGAHAAKPMGAITLELTAEAADDKFRESLAAVASLLGKTLPADSERVIHNITAFFVLPPGMPCMCGGRCALRPAPPLAEAEDSKDEDEDEEDDTGGDGCKPDLQGGDRPDGSGGAYVAAGRDCIGSAFDIHRSSLEARGAQLIQRPPRRAALAARSQLEEIASGELPEHVAAASSPAMPSPPSPPVPDLATPFEAHKHTASPLVSSLLRTSRSGSGGSISEVAPRRPGHQASPAKPALSSAEDSSSLRHRSSSSASSASYATSKSSGELRLGAIAQHPLWLCFTNPSLERKFALWSARKQCKVDVVVVVLAVAVYTCLVFTQPLLVKRAPATYSALMVFLLPLLCMAASIQWYCHVRDWVVTCMSFISFVIVQFVVYSSYLDSFDRQTLTTLVFLGRWVGLQALFISPLSNWACLGICLVWKHS
ncbi:hypothetical protein WJX72_004550 [[Myrmecia] bisecta]|uniref:Uncharacterized protein n=1 Tax=[Myrmecia] bisecta TaxID=41462 RepID=A0AAW1QQE5_9CHLO